MEAEQPSLDCGRDGPEQLFTEWGPHVAAWEGFPGHCSLSPDFSPSFSLSSSLVLPEMGVASDMLFGERAAFSACFLNIKI